MASEDLFRDFAIDVVYLEYVSFSAGVEIWWMDLRAENGGGLKYGHQSVSVKVLVGIQIFAQHLV